MAQHKIHQHTLLFKEEISILRSDRLNIWFENISCFYRLEKIRERGRLEKCAGYILFFKKECVHDLVYILNKNESHRLKVCTYQKPMKTIQGASYDVLLIRMTFCQQGFSSLKCISNLWCQSMTFNNSVMVKGRKETCLDPCIMYLIMIIRKNRSSLRYSSVLQTEMKKIVDGALLESCVHQVNGE